MKALVWNSEGMGSSLAISQLKENVLLFSLDIVFVSETKNKKFFLEKVKKKIIDFDNLFVVDAIKNLVEWHYFGGTRCKLLKPLPLLLLLKQKFTLTKRENGGSLGYMQVQITR
ncbi:hypothetical protein ACH5RR_011646 [Cinchona calisaya]|uniref:Uncharacterized protein n=1 Tax=Cinchona calisaya TaxID=153742 RepID=A0ABD3A8Y8_9GENT